MNDDSRPVAHCWNLCNLFSALDDRNPGLVFSVEAVEIIGVPTNVRNASDGLLKRIEGLVDKIDTSTSVEEQTEGKPEKVSSQMEHRMKYRENGFDKPSKKEKSPPQ